MHNVQKTQWKRSNFKKKYYLPLEDIIVIQSRWSLFRMLTLTIPRIYKKKSRSPGQSLEKPCYNSRGRISGSVLMKLGKNVFLKNNDGNIWIGVKSSAIGVRELGCPLLFSSPWQRLLAAHASGMKASLIACTTVVWFVFLTSKDVTKLVKPSMLIEPYMALLRVEKKKSKESKCKQHQNNSIKCENTEYTNEYRNVKRSIRTNKRPYLQTLSTEAEPRRRNPSPGE